MVEDAKHGGQSAFLFEALGVLLHMPHLVRLFRQRLEEFNSVTIWITYRCLLAAAIESLVT